MIINDEFEFIIWFCLEQPTPTFVKNRKGVCFGAFNLFLSMSSSLNTVLFGI